MTSTPYPTFIESPTSVYANLSAIGRCRISPKGLESPAYNDVLSKCKEHTSITKIPTFDPKDKETKKTLKKLYKQSVGALSIYLTSSEGESNLNLDPSINDVEIVLPVKDVLDTDGLIATVFLDAGVSQIVLELDCESSDETASSVLLTALEMTRLPRLRLIAHYSNMNPFEASKSILGHISKAMSLVSTVSLSFNDKSKSIFNLSLEEASKWKIFVEEHDKEGDVRLAIQCSTSSAEEKVDQVAERVGEISKGCKGKVLITLVDPTAKELGLSYAACCRTDRPDGLYTTVVCDRNNEALGLVYSAKISIVASLEGRRAVYYSRSRGGLWRKGDTSGRHQTLHRIDVDCDGDALRFTVTQHGADVKAFCHLGTYTCWGCPCGVRHLEHTLCERVENAPAGSYTKRLLDDEELLRDKLVEEAQELSEAVDKDDVAGELADVIYFAMVKAAKAGVSIDDAIAVLDTRARKVTRRQGDSKAFRIEAGKAILEKKN